MQARKITILLAITAISALTLFVISLLDGEARAAQPAPLPAVPDTLDYYAETVIVGPDGNADVEIAVVLGRGGRLDLLLPFDFEDASAFTILSGPADFAAADDGGPAPTVAVLGRRLLNLRTLPTAARGDTVRVAARLDGWFTAARARRPHGEFALKRRFVNRSAFVLRQVRVGVVLPPGLLVHSVLKVEPAHDPKLSPQPPYAVSRRGDRGVATVAAARLAPSEGVRLDLSIRPARRGLLPLVAGLALAALYLIGFRDVLKPQEVA